MPSIQGIRLQFHSLPRPFGSGHARVIVFVILGLLLWLQLPIVRVIAPTHCMILVLLLVTIVNGVLQEPRGRTY